MNDRLKFRVWDKQLNQYRTPGDIQLGANGKTFIISKELPNLYQDIEDVIVEFCTGLKDKNGNLIYEGDIIEIQCFTVERGRFTKTAKVVYSIYDVACEAGSCFALEIMDDEIKKLLRMWHSKECEIIGNIHEQKDAA